MDTPIQFWLVPFASLVALFFAWYFFRGMMRRSEGTERMQQIASAVQSGHYCFSFPCALFCFFGLWSWRPKQMGAVCLFDWRSFFWFGRVYWYADCYSCIGSYGPGCQ